MQTGPDDAVPPQWAQDSTPPDSYLRITPPQGPGTEGLLRLAIGVVVIAGLYLGRDVLIPITLAVLLSFVLSPIVELLRRFCIPHGLAVIASVLIALGLVGSIGTVVGSQMAYLSGDIPQYVETIQNKIASAQNFATSQLTFLSDQIQTQRQGDTARSVANTHADGGGNVVRGEGGLNTPLSTAFGILGSVLAPFETFIIVLVVAIFILLQKNELRDKMIRLCGSSDLFRTTSALDEAGERLSGYLLTQLTVNTGFGIVIGIGTWLIGLPVPLVWGVLAGVLRFVPYIGAVLGAVIPLIVAAGIDPGWNTVVYVALLFAICEPLTGYVIEPLLYGHSTGLSPLSVVVAAVFWTWIWGAVGLVLSMPLTLCLVVLGRHVPSLAFLDVLLGDRPALSPAESFYQRLLAGNMDDLTDRAETEIHDTSLARYYDDVALPALQLAAADVRRGAIERPIALQLAASFREFIDDLVPDANRDSAQATEARHSAGPQTVYCIAGRGVLDELVTDMFCQLLRQGGVTPVMLPNRAVSRTGIGQLELQGARQICLLGVDVRAGGSQVRAMVQRIRSRSDVPVLIGLVSDGPDAAEAVVVADRVTLAHSFVEAIGQCQNDTHTVAAV